MSAFILLTYICSSFAINSIIFIFPSFPLKQLWNASCAQICEALESSGYWEEIRHVWIMWKRNKEYLGVHLWPGDVWMFRSVLELMRNSARLLRGGHSPRSLSPIHSVWCFHPRLSAPRGLSEGLTSYFPDTWRALEGRSVDSPKEADGDQYFVINAGSCSSIFLYWCGIMLRTWRDGWTSYSGLSEMS